MSWQIEIEKKGMVYGVQEKDRCHFGELELVLHQGQGLSLAYLNIRGRNLICLLSEVFPLYPSLALPND